MSRIARIVVPGLAHHVTQRGNRRAAIFFEDGDHGVRWRRPRSSPIWKNASADPSLAGPKTRALQLAGTVVIRKLSPNTAPE
jgi:hypothetical protein